MISQPSAISIKEIPEKYRQFPKLSAGSSTIVLNYANSKVLMFTRDKYKFDYYIKMGIGEHLDTYYSDLQEPELASYPIHVFMLDRLYPLSGSKVIYIEKVINQLSTVYNKYSVIKTLKDRILRPRINSYVKDVIQHSKLKFSNFKSLQQLCDFIVEHGTSDEKYRIDLHMGNFMQTRDGEIVFFDPLFDPELLSLMKKLNRQNKLVETVLKEFIDIPDIPKRFHKFEKLGSGIDSLVLDYKDGKVLMFAEDIGKIHWLIASGLGKVVGSYDLPYQRGKNNISRTIHVLLVTKLYPVDKEVAEKIKKIRDFAIYNLSRGRPDYDPETDTIHRTVISSNYRGPRSRKIVDVNRRLIPIITKLLKKIGLAHRFDQENIAKFVKFYLNNGAGKFGTLDLHAGNFLQDENGKIYITDPFTTHTNDYFEAIPFNSIKNFKESKKKRKSREQMNVYEAAIAHDNLPEKLRAYKKLGSGGDSLVLDYSDTTVLMITPDIPKIEWLIKLGIGEVIGKFKQHVPRWYGSPTPTIEKIFYVLEVERFKELSHERQDYLKKIISFIDRHFTYVRYDADNDATAMKKRYGTGGSKLSRINSKNYKKFIRKVFAKFNVQFLTPETFDAFYEYIMDKRGLGNSIHLDLAPFNFMENSRGEIIMNDPIRGENLATLPEIDVPDLETISLKEYISKDELPAVFQKYPMIGRGTESIVLDYTDDTVLSFVDNMAKANWLVESGLAKVLAEFTLPLKSFGSKNLTRRILVLEVEKLYHVPSKNIKELYGIINAMMRYLSNTRVEDGHLVISSAYRNRSKNIKNLTKINVLTGKHKQLIRRFLSRANINFVNQDNFNKFIEFIYKYGGTSAGGNFSDGPMTLDLIEANLMITKKGELVLSDPLAMNYGTSNTNRFPKLTSKDVSDVEFSGDKYAGYQENN